jgi:hypothetical protein
MITLAWFFTIVINIARQTSHPLNTEMRLSIEAVSESAEVWKIFGRPLTPDSFAAN